MKPKTRGHPVSRRIYLGASLTVTAIVCIGLWLTALEVFVPRQYTQVYFAEPTAKASVRLTSSVQTIAPGELFSVRVSLNNPNIPIRDAVAILRYSASVLEVDTIYFSQLTANREIAFDYDQGAVRLSGRFEDGLIGPETAWAEIVFKSVQPGEASLVVDCVPGQLYETNLMTDTGLDIADCGLSRKETVRVQVVTHKAVGNELLCSSQTPTPPQDIHAIPGPSSGLITLDWLLPDRSTHTSIVYGEKAGEYPFGVPRIPRHPDGALRQQFVVRSLVPGRDYFFTLTSLDTCAISTASAIVSSMAQPLAADWQGTATTSATETTTPPFSFSLLTSLPNQQMVQFWTTVAEYATFSLPQPKFKELTTALVDYRLGISLLIVLLGIAPSCALGLHLMFASKKASAEVIRRRYAHLEKEN